MSIVITTGTFNLLLPNHVEFLKRAAGLGDSLYIFLDSDKRNKELKGDKVLFSFRERAITLQHLDIVDRVIEYDGPKGRFAQELVRLSDPGRGVGGIIFVKGGDYSYKDLNVDELEVLKKFDATVAILPLNDGLSTSDVFETYGARYLQQQTDSGYVVREVDIQDSLRGEDL